MATTDQGVETFRRGWRGWIRSSKGYSVRLLGRTNLQYVDSLGELKIGAEAMSKPWSNVVVDISSIPDRPEMPRDAVADRLRSAFAFAGWTLIESTRPEGR
jgi:hypothetical protein